MELEIYNNNNNNKDRTNILILNIYLCCMNLHTQIQRKF